MFPNEPVGVHAHAIPLSRDIKDHLREGPNAEALAATSTGTDDVKCGTPRAPGPTMSSVGPMMIMILIF